MRPKSNETMKTVVREGLDEANYVSSSADSAELREFANRMAIRLTWMLNYAKELEEQVSTVNWMLTNAENR